MTAPRYCVCLQANTADQIFEQVRVCKDTDIAIEVSEGDSPARLIDRLHVEGSSRRRIIWSLRPLTGQPIGPLSRWQDAYPIDRLERFLDELEPHLDAVPTHGVMLGWTPAWNDDLGPLGGLLPRRLDRPWLRIGVHTPRLDPSSTVPLIRDGLVDVVSTPFGLDDQRAAAWLLPVAEDAECDVLVRGDGCTDRGRIVHELAALGCDELPTRLAMTLRLASMHRSVSAVLCPPPLWQQEMLCQVPAIPDQWIDQISRRLAA